MDWTPEFEGQRPPLTAAQWAGPGNTRALTHGAHSESKLAPAAAEIERKWRAARRVKDDDPVEIEYMTRWVRARASEELFWHWMVEQPADHLVTEITSTDGDELARKGRVTRRSTARRRSPLLEQYGRLQGRTAAAWKEYRAYVDQRDGGRRGTDVVQLLTSLRAAHDAAEAAEEGVDGGE